MSRSATGPLNGRFQRKRSMGAGKPPAPLTLRKAAPNLARLGFSDTRPLPFPSSKLVGRQREIADIFELLNNRRCVTLIGAAGSGKTRLALEVAGRFASRKTNPPRLVELAPLAEPDLLPHTLAQAVGIEEEPGRAVAETLEDRLAGYDGLLVLDNCEHLIEACADIVDRLLRRCSGIQILATSREALRVDGEVAWVVPPLVVPAVNASLKQVRRSDAVQLFVDRARQAAPSFELTPGNASAVALICRQLDGLPLAIELAACRVSVVNVATIGDELADRFRYLTGGFRTAPGRQRTLRAAIDWSNDLLTAEERQLFYRLSVFAGSFDSQSADVICGGGSVPPGRVLELLERLLGKSLLVGVDMVDGRRRYRQLDSIRAYALERLRQTGELEHLRRRHAERFAALADLYVAQPDWPAIMLAHLDNFREALGWSESADPELHIHLAIGMGKFCLNQAYISEGSKWLQGAIRSGVKARPSLRADAALTASLLAWRRGADDEADAHASEAVRLRRREGNEVMLAQALGTLGFVRILAGRLKEAEAPLATQMAIAERLGDASLLEGAHFNLAMLKAYKGDLEGARMNLAHSRALAEGTERDTAMIRNLGGWVLLQMHDLEAARAEIASAVGQRLGKGSRVGFASDLDAAAEIAFLERAPERAMRLKGAADGIRDAAGSKVPLMSVSSRARWVSRAERSLGRAARSAWLEGRRLTMEEAASYALASHDAAPPRGAVPGEASLSRREIEVSELVAAGMTNDQIASRLRLSKRTIDAHLEHIRGKLDVRSRVEIATWLRNRQETVISS